MTDTDRPPPPLTHLDGEGQPRMVDVSRKPVSRRHALAEGTIRMSGDALAALRSGALAKGDAFAVARLAAIAGAKRTAELIPLCHPLPIDGIEVRTEILEDPSGVRIRVGVTAEARTGVEMEALVGTTVGLLAIYDMCKAVDRQMTLGGIRLLEKSGGTSGDWRVEAAPGTPSP